MENILINTDESSQDGALYNRKQNIQQEVKSRRRTLEKQIIVQSDDCRTAK